jgi:hypothetical protein
MKNVYEVLRQKELEVSRLEIEVEALRVVAPLLAEGEEAGNGNQPTLSSSTALPPPILRTAVNDTPTAVWGNRAKHWS